VLEAVQRVAGRELTIHPGARRPGDAARIVADNTRIRRLLGWQPRHEDLDLIVRTALAWERRPDGRKMAP
jgi:UDP-glucose 4-epimerase